ncbi:hypothetical protein M758_3G086700 [Ceratodon purpureus]|nr:hypothetical protein M758_3G086700 [Ceratodon purpureus]
MLRRGITPRDHHRENRALIAKTSAKNHALKQNPEGNTECKITSQEQDGQCNIQRQPRVKNRNGIDYITRNVQTAASNAPKSNPKVERLDYLKKENFGKVPAYLVKRKEELAQNIEKRLLENKNKNLPPGLVLMEDNDRVDLVFVHSNNAVFR